MANQAGVPASADLTAPTTAAVSASNVLAVGAQGVAPPLPLSTPLSTPSLPALPTGQPPVPLASTASANSTRIASTILATPTASAPVYSVQTATSTVQKPFSTQLNPSVASSQYKGSPGTIAWVPGFGARATTTTGFKGPSVPASAASARVQRPAAPPDDVPGQDIRKIEN